MTLNVIEQFVNIEQMPAVTEHQAGAGIEITIGDMHGNAIKLMYMLVKHGVATNLTEENYQRLVAIYKMPTENLTKSHLEEFNNILSKITFNKHILIRLIGDELADRGRNDYFTLKILEKLHLNKVPFEIILSNHSIEFIEACETLSSFVSPGLSSDLTPSLTNLQTLVDKNIVERGEILEIKKNHYNLSLRIISYSLFEDSNQIIIHSHAGIGLSTIKKMAEKFGVEYLDNTAALLAKTIDNINQKFQIHVQKNTVHTLYDVEVVLDGYRGNDIAQHPFEFTLLNRTYDKLDRPGKNNNYSLYFVHGHDDSERTQGNIYNLDNKLGKRDPQVAHYEYLGRYTVLCSEKNTLALEETPIACQNEVCDKKNSQVQLDSQVDKKSNTQNLSDLDIKFKNQLKLLKDKGEELKAKGKTNAAESAKDLITCLENIHTKLLNKEIEFWIFKKDSLMAIQKARSELEKHRGCKQILGNLALAIIGLGVGYAIAVAMNKAINGKFLFFQTDSAKQLDKLEASIREFQTHLKTRK